MIFTKASEASWSYFCDSKVSFYRVQILTPDYSGRRSPPPPPPPPLSPPPLSPLPTSPVPTSPPLFLLVFLPSSLLPSSLLSLRKFDSVLSSLFGIRLALRILRTHSLTLTLTAALAHSYSHSHSLTVLLSYYFSYLSYFFLISLISFSSFSLSLSLFSVSRLSISLFSLLSQEDPGKEPYIKDSLPLPPKRAPCFFLPRCPPLSHSGALAFAPPLGLKFLK